MSKNSAVTPPGEKHKEIVTGNAGDHLALFIELANAALQEVELPDLGSFDFGEDGVARWEAALAHSAITLKTRPAIGRLAERLQAFHRGNPDGVLINAYRTAHEMRKTLRGIVQAVNSGEVRNIPVPVAHIAIDQIQVTPGGKLEITPSPDGELYYSLLAALRDSDARRIRECPACHRIYWARRAHKWHCSDRCRLAVWRKEKPTKWEKIQLRAEQKRAQKAFQNGHAGKAI